MFYKLVSNVIFHYCFYTLGRQNGKKDMDAKLRYQEKLYPGENETHIKRIFGNFTM